MIDDDIGSNNNVNQILQGDYITSDITSLNLFAERIKVNRN